MKKRLLRILQAVSLLLFLFTSTYAHQDFTLSRRYGKLIIKYKTGFAEYELNHQMRIFGFLADKYIKENFDTMQIKNIVFDFKHNYLNVDTNYVFVGYNKTNIWEYSKVPKQQEEYYVESIVVSISAPKLDMSNTLKLIDFAFRNPEYIKTQQKRVEVHSFLKYHLNSISQVKINEVLGKQNPKIDEVLKTKVYCNEVTNNKPVFSFKRNVIQRNIDYYVQNEKYHFYKTHKSSEADTIYEEDILVLDNIIEIVSDTNLGHLVFNTDSTFHFIPQQEDTVLGAYKIDYAGAYRMPILKFHTEYNPNRFILFLDDFGSRSKVVFFTDYGILYNDNKVKENNFINEELGVDKRKDKNSGEKDWVKIFSISLNAILFLIIIQTYSKKKIRK